MKKWSNAEIIALDINETASGCRAANFEGLGYEKKTGCLFGIPVKYRDYGYYHDVTPPATPNIPTTPEVTGVEEKSDVTADSLS
ncbi:hypothetical protein [Butyrivibrio sp. VCB2006]|uniref:hypothetical protein n=1 Tax=Butyrivibrio sp. VCB2006 TaxID=1280679 RepID=UPI0003FD53BE|nr:hypothetical protein [Butyrivibrio sp. VCB2006]